MPNHVELWGWDGTAPWVPVLVDAAGHLQVDVLTAPAITGHCYGYDGAAWRALHTDAAGDLQVDILTIPTTTVHCQGYDGANWRNLHVDAAGDLQIDVLTSALPAGAATAANQATMITSLATLVTGQGHCYGYDGANWQTLLVESAANKNLRVKLYDSASEINSILSSSDVLTRANIRGLAASGLIYLVYSAAGMAAWRAANYVADTSAGAYTASVGLYGYNGSTWDRLRTYGTGILKVGRAECGISTYYTNADATVKATPGSVYWITIRSNDAANACAVGLNDGGSGGTTKWSGGVIAGMYNSFHAVFDPPIECATDIYVNLLVTGGGTMPYVTVGYL